MNYSVLMAVYYREKPENLSVAMQSVWNQTVVTDDFVLVCDGPLSDALDSVIEKMRTSHAELTVIRLNQNGGLGKALNYGIAHCKNELIARMDSDDISRPDRCEKQLQVFQSNHNLSIVSGTVEEFIESTDIIESRRVLPENQEDIIEFAKKRNPFNHPCVMFKKSAVDAVGGYQDFYLLEDYYLWLRMLQSGAIGYNIQQPLLWMRAGSDMYKRRAGWRYASSQRKLFQFMKKSGMITESQYIMNTILRAGVSLVPNWIREPLFKRFVRE